MGTKANGPKMADQQCRAQQGEGSSAGVTQPSAGEGPVLADVIATVGTGTPDLRTTELVAPGTHPDFQALLPPLSAEELGLLEGSLIEEGCRDELLVWKERNLQLDGHNRRALCKKHGIPFRVKEVSLPDADAAKDLILRIHVGRRNLHPMRVAYYRGKRYELLKHQGRRAGTSGQVAHRSTTAQKLAAEHHVDEKTIRRDAKLARHVDKLVQVCGNGAFSVLLDPPSCVTRADMKRLAAMDAARVQEAFETLKSTGKLPELQEPTEHPKPEEDGDNAAAASDEVPGKAAEPTASSQEVVDATMPAAAGDEFVGMEDRKVTASDMVSPGANAVAAEDPSGPSEPRNGEAGSAARKPAKKGPAKGQDTQGKSAFQVLKQAWDKADRSAQWELICTVVLKDEEHARKVREHLQGQ